MRTTGGTCATRRPADLEELELLAAAIRREGTAFERLVERHRSNVYALALRMMKDRAAAEEVLQETFLAAWQKLPVFRADSSFGSWVYRICANFCLMRLRRCRLERKTELEPAGPRFDASGMLLGEPSPDWTRGTEERALDHELRRAIEDAVAALPADYRVIFLLKDVEELSYEEIAQDLATSVAAVKSRLHRARLVLREAIDAFYEDDLDREGTGRPWGAQAHAVFE